MHLLEHAPTLESDVSRRIPLPLLSMLAQLFDVIQSLLHG